jgi:hypothetical protein
MLMSFFFSRDVRLVKANPGGGEGGRKETSPDRIKHTVKSMVIGAVLCESARIISIDRH